MFDCEDVPTGPTSVTAVRDVRIDAIMYQTERLELVETPRVPSLSTTDPIPNAMHPSDHVPIHATFRVRSRLQGNMHLATEWYGGLCGRECLLPLNRQQLREAFRLYDHDGSGVVNSGESLSREISLLLGTGVVDHHEMRQVVSKLPETLNFDDFLKAYTDALANTGMPGQKDFAETFKFFDTTKSGNLTYPEFCVVLTDCAPIKVSEEVIRELFGKIDVNSEGVIHAPQLVSYLAAAWLDILSP
jgi:Ca2+-binding EF-hand superfamily protein